MSNQTSGPLTRDACGGPCANAGAPAPRTAVAAISARRVIVSPALCGVRTWSALLRGGVEPHLRQHGAPEQAVRIGQRLQHLEVVVALADEELDRFAGRLHRRVEVARLALEFRRLAGTMGENERRLELIEMPLPPPRLLHPLRQLHAFRALEDPD